MHETIIEQNGQVQRYKIACVKPALCPLCSSTAENRAKITFVKGK